MSAKTSWDWIRKTSLKSGIKVRTGESGRDYLDRIEMSGVNIPETGLVDIADEAMLDFVEKVREWRRNLLISMGMMMVGIAQFPIMTAAGGTTALGNLMMVLCMIIAVIALSGNLFCRLSLASIEERPKYV